MSVDERELTVGDESVAFSGRDWFIPEPPLPAGAREPARYWFGLSKRLPHCQGVWPSLYFKDGEYERGSPSGTKMLSLAEGTGSGRSPLTLPSPKGRGTCSILLRLRQSHLDSPGVCLSLHFQHRLNIGEAGWRP